MFSWLIDSAHAMGSAGGGSAGGGDGTMIAQFMPFLLIMVVFYFLMIRPQQKKAKEHTALLASIQRGYEVVTVGGLMGRVTAVTEEVLTLEVAQNVKVRVQRSSIASVTKVGGGE